VKKITQEHTDLVMDAIEIMDLVSDILHSTDISEKEAHRLAWLLGSHAKRLEKVIDVMDAVEQKPEPVAVPLDDIVAIGCEILVLQEKLAALRNGKGGHA